MSIDFGETPLQQSKNDSALGESPLASLVQPADSSVQNNNITETNNSLSETTPNSVETTNDQEAKEKKAATKKHEAATITTAVLLRLSNEIPTNGTMTDSQKSIKSFTQLSEHSRNPQLEFTTPWQTTDGKPLKFTFTGTDRYEASEKGNLRLISINTKQVDATGTAIFMCRLEGLSKDVPIPINEILRAQLFTDGDLILQGISNEKQKAVVSAYIETQRNPNKQIDLDDNAIHNTGKEIGLLTSNILRAFIQQSTEEGSILQQHLFSITEGKNILSPQEATDIINGSQNIEEVIAQNTDSIQEAESRMQLLKAQLENATDPKQQQELNMQIAYINEQISRTKTSVDTLTEFQAEFSKNPMVEIFNQYYEGKGDLNKAKSIQRAMEKGEMMRMYNEMAGKIKQPEQKKKFDQMAQYAMAAGGIGLSLIILMLMRGINEN